MSSSDSLKSLNRRAFLRNTSMAGSGLLLALHLPGCASSSLGSNAGSDDAWQANAFVRITPDNRVIVISKHIEMGQGSYTGLATLVAEELDADWAQVSTEGAPADTRRYGNLAWGGAVQGTGGSNAIRNAYTQMREAGATARAMLVAAAASAWQVPAAEISVSNGVLQHASGQQASFGELATLAAQQPVPAQVSLKSPAQFTLIGRTLPRKDPGKTDGSAIFTQDLQLPGMLTAVLALPPKIGSTVKTLDAAAARQIDGVVDVLQVPAGIAVLARDYWSATKGRQALVIEWDHSKAWRGSSDEVMQSYYQTLDQPGATVVDDGEADTHLQANNDVLSADFEFPYLAHATMEPMNCVARNHGDRMELWYGAQIQTGDQLLVGQAVGLTPEQITIHMLYAGGSFGRRANPQADYVVQAAQIAKAYPESVPIKLVWSREDDMRSCYFRPMYLHRLQASLGADGYPAAWRHRIVGQSVAAGTLFTGALIHNGIDHTSVEGASNLPYRMPHRQLYLHTTEVPVPIQWWRSVGATHTAFSTETFIDQLAARAGKDPLEYRRHLLRDEPRHLGVLELAAAKAGWGSALPKGRFRGIAVHKSFESYVAQVAEIEALPSGKYRLHKITCAVDCGVPVNPDVIRAQMEGGIGFGLSPTFMSAITLRDGSVEQSNFHNYQVLRINQMPAIDVHIVPSTEPPTGVGEPGTPVVAPAVANAVFAASGQLPTRLPLSGLFV